MELDDQMKHVETAMDDGAATAQHLAQVNEVVEKASRATGIATKDLTENYYLARSMALDHAQALGVVNAANLLVIGTTSDHASAMVAEAQSARVLSTITHTLGGAAGDWADQLALLQSTKGFSNIAELNSGLQYVLPSMKAMKIASADVFGAMGTLSTQGYQSERIGTGLQEVITKLAVGKGALHDFVATNAQGGLDLYNTIGRIAQATQGLNVVQKTQALNSLGFNLRDAPVLETLMARMNEYRATMDQMAHAHGEAQKLANIREAGGEFLIDRLLNNINLLREALGKLILPNFQNWTATAADAVGRLLDFVKAHSELVKVSLAVAAIASGLLIVGGVLALAGSAVLGFISAWAGISAVVRLISPSPWRWVAG